MYLVLLIVKMVLDYYKCSIYIVIGIRWNIIGNIFFCIIWKNWI